VEVLSGRRLLCKQLGDAPEAVEDALHDVLNLDYRKEAIKMYVFCAIQLQLINALSCVIISDAPPHGLTSRINDGLMVMRLFSLFSGFPNGCPSGHDPLKISRELADRGIILYCVGCEPVVSSQPFVKDFFKAIAEITGIYNMCSNY
jgi:hypothetical protein